MAFNLYFAGSSDADAELYLQEHGCLRLLSYYREKSLIERWKTELKTPVFVDSGAFTAHTKGIEIDINDYISYVNDMDEGIRIFAELDKIPGEFGKPKTSSQLLEAPQISWLNYLYIAERLKSREKCLPIFHQGEDFIYLHQMLNFEPKIPYIGISPANDQPIRSKEAWIKEVFKIIKNSKNPDVKTHAFGFTALNLLEIYPFYSADSTSWILTSAMGSILSSYGTLNVSDKQSYMPNHANQLPKVAKEKIVSEIEKAGFTWEGIMTDYRDRYKWNVLYLQNWAENYKYKPITMVQNRLF